MPGVPFALHAKGIWEGFATPEGIALIPPCSRDETFPIPSFLMGLAVAAGSPDEWRVGRSSSGIARPHWAATWTACECLAQRYLTVVPARWISRKPKPGCSAAGCSMMSSRRPWLAALYVIHPELNPELDDPGAGDHPGAV